MLNDLQWFVDRIGKYVLRGTTRILIKDVEVAGKLFTLQGKDYLFKDGE